MPTDPHKVTLRPRPGQKVQTASPGSQAEAAFGQRCTRGKMQTCWQCSGELVTCSRVPGRAGWCPRFCKDVLSAVTPRSPTCAPEEGGMGSDARAQAECAFLQMEDRLSAPQFPQPVQVCPAGGCPPPLLMPLTHPGPSECTVGIRARAFLPGHLHRPSLDLHFPKVQVKLSCLTLI